MKLRTVPFLVALLFAFHPECRAQDDGDGSTPVKVTITRYADHSYTAMTTNADAHSAESATYDASGHLQQTIVFVLDEEGRAVGGLVYAPKGTNPKGTLVRKTAYKYDSMNRVSEMDKYTATDQLQSRLIYHYDASGKVTKEETYDPAGNLISTSTSAGTPDIKREVP